MAARSIHSYARSARRDRAASIAKRGWWFNYYRAIASVSILLVTVGIAAILTECLRG